MSEPTKPPRRKRAKATTPLGRSILQKERQRLAKEQAKLGEEFTLAARHRLADRERVKAIHSPEHAAVNRGMIRRVATVLASEHVNVPILATSTEGTYAAWTDFEKISIQYHLHEDARLTAAVLRGMLYHEGGHIRFTIPFPQLRLLAQDEWREVHGAASELPKHPDGDARMHYAWNVLEDQRMETAVTSDSPRKAIYFTPMLMAEHMRDVNSAKDNWPLLVWRKYLPKHLRDRARSYWVQENGEDKAVEVEETVRSYVTAETALDMWLAVVRMTEHLKGVTPITGNFGHHYQRNDGKDGSDKLIIPIDPAMLDEDELEAIKKALEEAGQKPPSDTEVSQDDEDPDCDLPSAEDDDWLPEEPQVEYQLPIQNLDDEPERSNQPSSGNMSEQDEAAEGESDSLRGSGDIDAPAEDGDGQGNGSKGDDKGADAGTNDGQPSKGAGSTGSHGDTDTSTEAPTPSFQDELDEALEDAETERYEDKALDGDVEAYENAKWDADSDLLPYIPGVEDDGGLVAVADNLAYEIEQAFEANTLDRAPAWVEGQRRGVVNVMRYETRQPQDTEFYRAWIEDDAPGFDISVSVLLDYSGSMQDKTAELAQAGYASKAACDRLGIPCSVLLWDTDARTLWDAWERAEAMPRITVNGGTDPSVALADLDAQRVGRAKHLVLIFTDGSWSGAWGDSKNFNQYKAEDRYFISFVMGSSYLAEQQRRMGADEAYVITDLLDIPRRLEQALIELA